MDEYVPDIDLGDDHYLVFTRWAPDDLLPNRERYGYPLPVVEKCGAFIRHYKPDGVLCEGSITFDGEWQRKVFGNCPLWNVVTWEPLTLTPSLLCHCGDHGLITNGKWVRA